MKIQAFVIVEENNSFLLIREAASKWRNSWFFPGGTMDEGEDISMAAIRETKEESGIDIELNGIFFIEYHASSLRSDTLKIYLTAKKKGGVLKEFADSHSLGAQWYEPDEITSLKLRDPILPDLLQRYSSMISPLPLDHFLLK